MCWASWAKDPSCAIARNCEGSSHFGQAMDDCLQLAADVKLKFFISEPACAMSRAATVSPTSADVDGATAVIRFVR